MTDISCGNLYIKSICSVQRGSIGARKRPTPKNGRHSDALVYILSGECDYSFSDGEFFHAVAGDIIYLANGARYSMSIGDSAYSFIFCDFFFDSDDERRSGRYPTRNASDAENLFRRLCTAYGANTPDARLRSMSILYEIYAVLCLTESVPTCEHEQKIFDAVEYIETSYTDPQISVSEIAHRANMSEVYFRKLFKKLKLVSPSQYITSLRIKSAKSLLRLGFMSLEECALQSGFSSVQYFCRVFKKSTGLTPSQYREQK